MNPYRRRHHRYTAEVARHPAIPSSSLDDISRSKFVTVLGCAAQHGSPPDSLNLGSRMHWRPEGAGHYLLVFADGLLILTRGAYRRLPHPPAAPEPSGSKTVKAMVTLASVALGPVSELVDIAGHLAEGLTDIAMDRISERYAKAHPEWERENQEKLTAWQQAFAAEAADADGVLSLPRSDLVRYRSCRSCSTASICISVTISSG